MKKSHPSNRAFTGIVHFPSFLSKEQGEDFSCQLLKVCCDKLPIFNSETVNIELQGDQIQMHLELLPDEAQDLTPEEAVSWCWAMAIRDILADDVEIQEVVSR